MKRRTGLLAAAALVGGGAGVGTAWWRSARAPASGASVASVESTESAASAFWAHSFVDVDGRTVSMSQLHGKPLLLNFWATWCPPCVAEMPLLDAFNGRSSAHGWRLLAVAVDSAEPVRAFLDLHRLDLPVALAGAAGLQLSRDLGNGFGGLPFTVVFDAMGRIAHRKVGAVDATLLNTWLGTT